MAKAIREVAVERERSILHQRVHPEMEALGRLAALGRTRERLVELMQIPHFDHQVEFAQRWQAKAELTPHESPVLDQSFGFEVPHIFCNAVAERDVADSRLEIAPGVIDVHASPASITAAHFSNTPPTRCQRPQSPYPGCGAPPPNRGTAPAPPRPRPCRPGGRRSWPVPPPAIPGPSCRSRRSAAPTAPPDARSRCCRGGSR